MICLVILLVQIVALLAHDGVGVVPRVGKPWIATHMPPVSRTRYLSAISNSDSTLHPSQVSFTSLVPPPVLEIEPLIVSGPYTNRIDLVFFSDGYTETEKAKFLEDAKQLADDISGNQTFNTVKPLLNFWAAFTPSHESGVGVGGVPKDTVYGLYRDGTELRGVYYDKPEVARAACDFMGQQCDYPILLGNDPLYGGLGGEFTVITSSIANGPLVLRHELGHSVIDVGEEYDGGFAYFGVNAFHDLSEPVPWLHWMTEPPKSPSETYVERSVMPLQIYAWTMLNTTDSYSTKFISSGTFSRHVVKCSLSGLPEKEDLRVELDGQDLGWVPKEGLGVDRWHYEFHVDKALSGGEHELKFTLLNAAREGQAQLCSTEILEFGNAQEFRANPGFYGVYPTFSETNETSYRPTNDDCLMRMVTTPNFCKVCIEGLWYSALARVNLIDGVKETCDGGSKVLKLTLVPLANLRETPVDVVESWTITWRKGDRVIPEYTNSTTLVLPPDTVGTFSVDVQYSTEQIRRDTGGTTDRVVYEITTTCAM